MRGAVDRVIEGTTYRVVPVAAGIGNKVMLRLGKVGAPALFTLLASPKSTAGAFAAAIPGLVRALDLLTDDDMDFLCKSFAAETQFGDGSKMRPLAAAFDEHFRGNYAAMFQWLRFSMEVNFGPLWTWATGLLPEPPPAAGQPAKE